MWRHAPVARGSGAPVRYPVERLRWAVNGVINAQQKRMLKSFPKFQVPDRQDIIDSLRELMGPRR